jgi:hypothetical protein
MYERRVVATAIPRMGKADVNKVRVSNRGRDHFYNLTPRVPSTNVGPRHPILEMSKVDSNTPVATGSGYRCNRRTGEAIATFVRDPK